MDHADYETENREIMHGWIQSEDLKTYGFESPALQHLSAKDLRRILPEETFNNYFKFAIVRNPWDRMLSQYLFDRLFKQPRKEREARRDFSFDEFSDYIRGLPAFLRQGQYEFITDEKGECLVDFIGRFENLASDFRALCRRMGVPERHLPHINSSRHTHYSAYYTEETKRRVEELFEEDIEMFGYRFEKRNWMDHKTHGLIERIRQKIYKASQTITSR
jgi:hypothetical protein